MIPYLILYIIIFFLSFKIKKNKVDIWDFLLCTILVLFSALRYGIGIDYVEYEGIYWSSHYLNGIITSKTGFGFFNLMRFFAINLDFKYPSFIAFCSIITILCIYYFYKKNSELPGLSILLFVSLGFYTDSFNSFRQFMALSIVLVGYQCFKDKKFIRFLLLSSIAIVIHSISIIPILTYIIIEKINNHHFSSILIIIISILFYFNYDFIFSHALTFLPAYIGYINYKSIPGIGTYLLVLFYYVLYIYLAILNRKNVKVKSQKYINLFSIGICIMALQLRNWLFSRIVLNFIIFVPIILADLYKNKWNSNYKLEKFFLYVVLFLYFTIYINSFGEVIPYKTIFNKLFI